MGLLIFFVNTYFDFLIAVLLGIWVGIVAAVAAVKLRFTQPYVLLNNFLLSSFILGYVLMFFVSFMIAKTDPDFSALQRYKNAFNNIKSFIWREDELLLPGGFEKALALNTS
ncbi:MAG: hypothetical protein AB1650_01330, partial [Candidatus Omnitrophota bacterium]